MRPMTAFFISMILAGWCLCSGGCQLDSGQRLALLESTVTQAQAAVTAATNNVTALQAQLTAAQQAGADSAALAKVQAALSEALAQKPQVYAFLKTAQDSLAKAKENPTISTEVETYGSLLVSALGVALAAYFRCKVTQANTEAAWADGETQIVTEQLRDHRAALKAVVTGVESAPIEVQAAVKPLIGQAMAKDTLANAVIDGIKAQ
jgi:hypothetical protein